MHWPRVGYSPFKETSELSTCPRNHSTSTTGRRPVVPRDLSEHVAPRRPSLFRRTSAGPGTWDLYGSRDLHGTTQVSTSVGVVKDQNVREPEGRTRFTTTGKTVNVNGQDRKPFTVLPGTRPLTPTWFSSTGLQERQPSGTVRIDRVYVRLTWHPAPELKSGARKRPTRTRHPSHLLAEFPTGSLHTNRNPSSENDPRVTSRYLHGVLSGGTKVKGWLSQSWLSSSVGREYYVVVFSVGRSS